MKKITFLQISLTIAIAFCFLITSNSYAQVGIGTTTPTTDLDINGSLSLRDGGTLALSNGLNNNVSLGATPYSVYRITGPTAIFVITGIVPIAAADGQIVTIQNTTSETLVITHDDINSAAANRIYIPAEQDLFLSGRYSSVTLQYSDAQNKWIVQNKLSDETIWFYPPANYNAGTTTIVTATGIPCTSLSAVSVNLLGNWAVSPGDDITIHHIEARTGEVRFIVSNNTFFTNYTGMDFVISIRN